jgi:hypothetical protein
MKIHNIGKVRIEEFNSFGEYIRLAKGNTEPKSSNGNSEKWAGTATLQDACDLATHGWDEVRPKVDNLLADLEPRLADAFGEYYVTRHDVAGSFVDVGAFVTGEPECMVEFVPEPDSRMGRVIKVVVAGTASAFVDPDDIQRRGIAVLALVDVIHKMGLGIELWWDSTVTGTGGDYSTAVKLHDSSEPLDINTVMFALAHPSMLRRLQFSVQEQSIKAKAQGVGSGYGTPSQLGILKHTNFDVVVEKLQDGSGDIVANPFEWVVSTVTGLGLIEN